MCDNTLLKKICNTDFIYYNDKPIYNYNTSKIKYRHNVVNMLNIIFANKISKECLYIIYDYIDVSDSLFSLLRQIAQDKTINLFILLTSNINLSIYETIVERYHINILWYKTYIKYVNTDPLSIFQTNYVFRNFGKTFIIPANNHQFYHSKDKIKEMITNYEHKQLTEHFIDNYILDLSMYINLHEVLDLDLELFSKKYSISSYKDLLNYLGFNVSSTIITFFDFLSEIIRHIDCIENLLVIVYNKTYFTIGYGDSSEFLIFELLSNGEINNIVTNFKVLINEYELVNWDVIKTYNIILN